MTTPAAAASAIAACRISWAEAMAAVARRQRACPADGAVRERSREDWHA